MAVTCFSLITQTLALGLVGSTIAWQEVISVPILVLTALPHALLELTAVFLPLAAWTIASRKGEWDQLLAATMVTVLIAIPSDRGRDLKVTSGPSSWPRSRPRGS